jgi:AbrB family looped-hinge helix DNA binding protein
MQATLTSKAQITLPKDLRDLMGLKAGDKVEFTALPDGSARVTRAGAARGLSFSALQGILPKPAKALTVDDMNLGLAATLATDNDRISR